MPRRANIRPGEPGRERVLEAGRELFGERGYHATSIAEIGERAGIAKSVLYHYFASKSDLYVAIEQAETRDLLEHVAAAVPRDPRAARLRAGVDAYLEFLAARPAAWRLLVRDPPADPELIAAHERLARERSAALGELIASPAKREAKPVLVELVGVTIRAFAAWWYEHREVPREQVVDVIVEVARASARRLAPARAPAAR